MMFHGYGMGPGWSLIVFAFVLPMVLLAAGLVAAWARRESPGPSAERILADRLAAGEIGTEEYEERLRTLRAVRR
ncbi:SHOCT domain-containing protein [Paractinoplanes atraurantiacus]|uniref:Short C-terminal domain-containing protein n=1 Tax=Paractinoplanes atraurantiacus TaxID=1036182 RepID=A0A285JVY5_9ACTN|nr:hypothetical protein [Actinoplanes atraurantiacus]SNY64203.1 hypothetical protein SAMN05421748_12666 [Actinoplanes atraurantiacus]